ncbi:MAG: excinuclease ABC subunit A [Candidatus Berkelbacteria bacterium Licking1014_2]|uniref:UvrABC system protein A n=1 Tax=Candidatus Berkelbacteria bacterium Licking1014_2 TaxID=2017146 RepID=A0A554LWA5_9BACT|nr:MAG: excinuclease ABC subunit A [Candidatus Berkelbacteria bacterium Licking1014_2]
MNEENIVVRGARVHNLKNINITIPKNKLTVITGLSGSGKSSLAFDVIYAEGQRRYIESMTSFSRQFLNGLEKPDVDYIKGLSPTLAIDQKTAGRTPRSTVGTMSEVYDYLRLLFSKVGQPSPPAGGLPVAAFSFNAPAGACPDCHGLGKRWEIAPNLIVPNPKLTLSEGAIRPWARLTGQSVKYLQELTKLSRRHKFSMDEEVGKLSVAIKKIILFGEPRLLRGEPAIGRGEPASGRGKPNGSPPAGEFAGVIPELQNRYNTTDSDYLKREIESYMIEKECRLCAGARLNQASLKVKIGAQNIAEMSALPIIHLKNLLQRLKWENHHQQIAGQIIPEIIQRLDFLIELGLSYLSLNRSSDTLAGGEAQRIRLAALLSAGLTGVIYILDEPSIGLHQADQKKLLKILKYLRDLGNTVIVVEHDLETIKEADWVIDVGPGAGFNGGKIIASGQPNQVAKNVNSLTGDYLSGRKKIAPPAGRRRPSWSKALKIIGASANNLKDIDATIPLGLLVGVAGVSGSGKSTLIYDILARTLNKKLYRAKKEPGSHKKIEGLERIGKIVDIDQAPIGRMPRSNVVTYTGIFNLIRYLFADQPTAKNRDFPAARFSFNLKGGRCETCRGDGVIKIEMHFMPDIYATCQTCQGKKYNQETLEINYQGKNIADILQMTVSQAKAFFIKEAKISQKLQILEDIGLGYLPLGQPAPTFSGGEAQRIKLAAELMRPQETVGRTLYILDEPTTGLHPEDIKRLLAILQSLVAVGNSVIVIEHHLDVLAACDWLIDLGPAGGEDGGRLVSQGTPEKISQSEKSLTGKFLRTLLA